MNNKRLGTAFERHVCQKIAETGAWVHFLSPDEKGNQPFDLIAVQNNVACAIECKTLNDTAVYFPITRLEDNQILAFEKWISCGNLEPIIAIGWRGECFFVGYSELKQNKKIDMRKLKQEKEEKK